jgi:hypothetical protein
MLASQEAVYQRVTDLLLLQHQLAWSDGARPTPAGLLDCLTQDVCWEVLSAHRQGEPASSALLLACCWCCCWSGWQGGN